MQQIKELKKKQTKDSEENHGMFDLLKNKEHDTTTYLSII